jgi:tetratricopeptide (TPR) repeat protein
VCNEALALPVIYFAKEHRMRLRLIATAVLIFSSVLPALAINHQQYASMDHSVFVLIKGSHWEAAKPILLQMCDSPYATPDNFCTLAKCYINQVPGEENLAKADRFCKRAISMDPECGQALACLGEVCYLRDEYDEALRLTNRSLACKSPDFYAYYIRAKVEIVLHQYKDALVDLDRWDAVITVKDPKARPNYQLKGQVSEKMGKYQEAIGEYRKALPFEAEGQRKNIIRCLQKLNKLNDAVTEANAMIKNNPRDGDSLCLRADLEMQMHDYKDALADYSKAIDIAPLSNYFKKRSKVYEALGQKEQAKKDSEKAGSIEF